MTTSPLKTIILILGLIMSFFQTRSQQAQIQKPVKLNQAGNLKPKVVDPTTFQVSPDGKWVVYVADQDTPGQFELYSVPPNGSRKAEKLNPPLPKGGQVLRGYGDFAISPDSKYVVFLATANDPRKAELFSVPIAGGEAIKLNRELRKYDGIRGKDFDGPFQISPDSKWVGYLATEEDRINNELYRVSIDGAVSPQRVSDAQAQGQLLHYKFQFSSDSKHLIFRTFNSVRFVLSNWKLFSSPIAAPQANLIHESPQGAMGAISFRVSSNGSSIVFTQGARMYLASMEGQNKKEIVKIESRKGRFGVSPAAFFMDNYQLTSEGKVFFIAELGQARGQQLYTLQLDGGPVQLLSRPEAGDVAEFKLNDQAGFVIYANKITGSTSAGDRSKLVLNVTDVQSTYTLNIASKGVLSYHITTDDLYTFYQLDDGIYVASNENPSFSTKLTHESIDLDEAIFLEDQQAFIYRKGTSLCLLDLGANPVVSRKIEKPQLTNSNASIFYHGFQLSAQQDRVVYMLDGEKKGVYNLYASDLPPHSTGFRVDVTAAQQKSVSDFETKYQGLQHKIKLVLPKRHKSAITGSLSRNKQYVITGDRDGHVILWQEQNLRQLGSFKIDQPVSALYVSDQGQAIVGDEKGKIWLLNKIEGVGVKTVQLSKKSIRKMIIGTRMNYVMALTDSEVTIYDLKSHNIRKTIKGKFQHIALNEGGGGAQYYGYVTKNKVYYGLLNGADAFKSEKEIILKGASTITAIRFFPGPEQPGRRDWMLMTGNGDGALEVWNESGDKIHAYRSPDGTDLNGIPIVAIDRRINSQGTPERSNYAMLQDGRVWSFRRAGQILDTKFQGKLESVSELGIGPVKLLSTNGSNFRIQDISMGTEPKISEKLHSGRFFRLQSNTLQDENASYSIDSIGSFADIDRFTKNEPWLIINESGQYYGAKQLLTSIHFSDGKNSYPTKTFDLVFNRPDVIAEEMNFEDSQVDFFQRIYQKRVGRFLRDGNTIPIALGQLPTIDKVSASIGSSFSSTMTVDSRINMSRRRLNVRLEGGSPAGKKIVAVNVSINNVPLYGRNGKLTRQLESSWWSKSDWTDDLKIDLNEGLNFIKLSITDESGITSREEQLEVMYSAPKLKPDLYLLSIGVSKFSDPELNLNYAAKDARDISSTFSKSTRYNQVHQIQLLNEQVTNQAVLDAKDRLKDAKIDDVVIAFVASHGLVGDELDYYLGTSQTPFDSPQSYDFPYQTLESILEGIPARKKLIMIDACHSGELDEGGPIGFAATTGSSGVTARGFRPKEKKAQVGLSNSIEVMKLMFNDVRSGSGTVVISSASGAEYAFESPEWKNGVFTYAVLEGIKNKSADIDQDGAIRVSELKDYVFDRVNTLTNGQQNPTSRRENLENNFVIWEY